MARADGSSPRDAATVPALTEADLPSYATLKRLPTLAGTGPVDLPIERHAGAISSAVSASTPVSPLVVVILAPGGGKSKRLPDIVCSSLRDSWDRLLVVTPFRVDVVNMQQQTKAPSDQYDAAQ